jgi:mono/diheme cytochrome c family protein
MRTHVALLALVAVAAPLGGSEARERGPRVSAQEYDGWRQYSVQCARCHGQEVTGNPVAANLLVSTRSGGPVADKEAFVSVAAGPRGYPRSRTS